ncbi:MAG: hypothetical protein WCX88_00235 [Patescibacteria group bacterium]
MEQNENKNVDYGKQLASWEFDEFQEHDRSLTWYIVIGVIFLGLLLYSVLSSNFLFALIIILGGATFIFGSFKKQARKIPFEIFQDGIVINHNFTSFDDLKSFWIVYNPPEVKTLYFEQSSILKGELNIPLEKQNPVRIREILLGYLKEDLEKDDESFVDLLRRRAKL